MRDSGCLCNFIDVPEVPLDSSILPHKAVMTKSNCISDVGDFVTIASSRVSVNNSITISYAELPIHRYPLGYCWRVESLSKQNMMCV